MSMEREAAEAEITRLLCTQWDPLGHGDTHDGRAAYAGYAHELYGLLARGGSDVQVTRRLHEAERDELQHPELVERDISALVGALRALERVM